MANLTKILNSINEKKEKKEYREKLKKQKEKEKEKAKLKRQKEKLKLKEKKLKEKEEERNKIKKEKEKEKQKKIRIKLNKKNKELEKRKIEREKKREERKEAKIKDKIERKNKKSYFRLIVTSRNKINATIKATYFEDKAIEYFNEEREKAIANVKFPMKYRNTFGKIVEAKNELLLVQKIPEENQSSFIKNTYGKYVENIVIDRSNYVIVDKCDYPIEETFFVYGYHPYYERKTFDFIYNEMVKNDIYTYVSVVCFRNKLVIEYDYDMNIIICKNVDDCIRLYNVLNEYCIKDKISKVVFKGQIPYSSSKNNEMIEKIKEKTGWNEVKIRRTSTRP